MVYPPTGSTAYEREMSTPPTLLRSMALFYLYLFTFHLQPYKIKFDSTGLVGVSLFTCESAEAAQLSTLTAVAVID